MMPVRLGVDVIFHDDVIKKDDKSDGYNIK
jgi:hypothetical protein